MPELDGYGVLTQLQQDVTTAAIPFIFLTAKAERSALRQGIELGADDYLTKPFTPAELLRAITVRLKKRATVTQYYTNQIKQAEAGLDYLVHYDSLTHLPNQRLLQKQFNQIQAQLNGQAQLLPLLLIGLDQFSQINEAFGHAFSNLLLKAVAERLVTWVKGLGHPINTLACLNTEQFTLLLKPMQCQQDAAKMAQTILGLLAQPFELNGHKVFITASIGITLYPNDSGEFCSLATNAEMAMNRAKQRGGNHYQFYTPDMQVSPFERLALEASLRHALERSEFQVYYQPQVDLKTGQIISAEALVRWCHPEHGLISPAKFIPLAEATGLIVPLGEWVLRTACTQAKAWQLANFVPLQVAVNLSVRQFNQPNLSQKVARILQETGLEPQFLDLELTESMLMQDTEAAIKTMIELKALGISISIDDFGIGYSSLSYLQKFCFDTLKIDQCFVRNIDSNPGNAAITAAVTQMAHSLNLKVIAEGVETELELACLRQQQCDAMQGYLFSRPILAIEFEKLLATAK
jgi:diguanylate cyclase (GGDEF)-like protein